MRIYRDIIEGLNTSPRHGLRCWTAILLIYTALALTIGLAGGLYSFQLIDLKRGWFLPLSLFIFPALAEEIVFRGILIPRSTSNAAISTRAWRVTASSAVFVLWHPINALTINPSAQRFFLDPIFLIVVFLLGLAAGLAYVVTRSLWVPIIMHWLTVVVWVMGLGGRNLLLD